MNGINRTSAQILEALNEWGDDTRFCSECKEFHPRNDPGHYEHSRHSYHDLQVELEEAFLFEQELTGKFIEAIADALGVDADSDGAYSDESILQAIADLKEKK